jgi:hypothetical protein
MEEKEEIRSEGQAWAQTGRRQRLAQILATLEVETIRD